MKSAPEKLMYRSASADCPLAPQRARPVLADRGGTLPGAPHVRALPHSHGWTARVSRSDGWELICEHHGQNIPNARESSSVLRSRFDLCLGSQDSDGDETVVFEGLAKTDD